MGDWAGIEGDDVVFHSPGKSDRSAMPLGNGETAVSVWMTEAGALRFYISRSDAVTELERTVKLGLAEVVIDPCFCRGKEYSQRLVTDEGRVEFRSELGFVCVWVDCDSDVIFVEGCLNEKVSVRAGIFSWRTEARRPYNSPVFSTGLTESADVLRAVVSPEDSARELVFYHQNGENGLEYLAGLQKIEDPKVVPDVMSGRVFGGILRLDGDGGDCGGFARKGCSSFLVKIAVSSGQVGSVEELYENTELVMRESPDAAASKSRTANHWRDFWERSYIFVRGDRKRAVPLGERIEEYRGEPSECSDTDSWVTRAYVLTRFMMACCKDGNFPIYYNGALFNLCPGNGKHLEIMEFAGGFTRPPEGDFPTPEINPDERSWTIEHLWQNLRLPYYSMLAAGDFDSMKRLFGFFRRFWDLNRLRARKYYGLKGSTMWK